MLLDKEQVALATSDIGKHFGACLEQMRDRGSIGYWIGTLAPSAPSIEVGDALGMGSTMSFQYDVEDQADLTGYVFPREAEWRRYFEPAAPVQLTDGWSPLDAAIERLGAPSANDVSFDQGAGRLAAALGWAPQQIADALPSRARGELDDQRRFVGLVEVVIMRARKKGWGALLVVRPGWSYEWMRVPPERLRAAWSRAGFATDDRRPRSNLTGRAKP